MYHLPHVCRTQVPKIRVRFVYVGLLTSSRAWFTTDLTRLDCSTEQQGQQELLVSAMKITDEDR